MNHAFANELSPADKTINSYDGLYYAEAFLRKQHVLKIACHSLSPIDAHVSLKSGRGAKMTEMHFLEYAHIGEVDAPMQSIVLRNECGTSIDYRLYVTDVERLNA